MRDDSPTWVDLKVKLEGDLLMHFEFRGYRSDSDMTVQVNHISDTLISVLQATPFIPTFVVTIFQGWRVVTCSWEVGGRIYAISEGGIVVSLDYPLCHVELRLVSISSKDAFGMDADRIEFRFWSAADRLDVACSSCSVPPSWLVVSRVSGPTLIQNANWCRKKFARIESPDPALQLAQLASVHAHWTAAINAESESDTGPRISAVAVESHPDNMHLISESPLFRKDKVIVSMDALALQAHDPETEQQSAVLPPITGGPAVQPASEMTNTLKASTPCRWSVGSSSWSAICVHHRTWYGSSCRFVDVSRRNLGTSSAYLGAEERGSDGLLGHDTCWVHSAGWVNAEWGRSSECSLWLLGHCGGDWWIIGWISWGFYLGGACVIWTTALISNDDHPLIKVQ